MVICSEHLQELVLQLVGSGDKTQGVRHNGKCLYPLTTLLVPNLDLNMNINNLNVDKFKYLFKHGMGQQCADQTQRPKVSFAWHGLWCRSNPTLTWGSTIIKELLWGHTVNGQSGCWAMRPPRTLLSWIKAQVHSRGPFLLRGASGYCITTTYQHSFMDNINGLRVYIFK